MHVNPENTLIGDVIDSPSVLLNVRRIVPAGSMFADERAGKIYDLILAVYDERGAFDLAVVSDRGARAGVPASELLEYASVAQPSMAEIHARIVAENYMKRTAVASVAECVRDLNAGGDVSEAIDTAVGILANLKRGFEQEKTVHIGHVVQEAVDELDDILSGKKSMGVPFGFEDLDSVTGGMEAGDLVVMAAPEKSGKSTLMIQVVFYNASRGVPCLIFSSEMMRKQILYRKALIDTKIRWIDLKRNRISEDERLALYRRLHELAALPIYIRHGVISILDIVSDVERYRRERSVALVAVDYIQRIVPVSKKANENREREVAAISSGLKNIAIDNGIPVIALSQVNEEGRARESRAIEQDMDKMISIGKRPETTSDSVEIPIGIRQRMGLSGNIGDVKLNYDLLHGYWRSVYTRSEDMVALLEAEKLF